QGLGGTDDEVSVRLQDTADPSEKPDLVLFCKIDGDVPAEDYIEGAHAGKIVKQIQFFESCHGTNLISYLPRVAVPSKITGLFVLCQTTIDLELIILTIACPCYCLI